jgi:hypothetical protein|tara:strand:+ start:250 stop:396 length:147 start_codon:yes stop_codon:yes gene_type:complete
MNGPQPTRVVLSLYGADFCVIYEMYRPVFIIARKRSQLNGELIAGLAR